MIIENGKIQVSNVFDRLNNAYNDFELVVTKEGKLKTRIKKRKFNVFVLEGGSRSSKTISIIQFLLLYAQVNAGVEKRVIISRAVATWIKGTVLHDFLKVLRAYGWYQKKNYNKSDKTYLLFDTEFCFVGLDDQQKLHGMTCDVFWINEAIEASRNDFDQLEMRCSEFAIVDYNPTEEEHWIYDTLCKRPDCFFLHSTMLDNPFLPENMRRKILSYEPTDKNFENGTADKNKWDIYGLGKRAKIEGLVFDRYEVIDEIPAFIKKRYTGIDFGYSNDVTAMGEVAIHDNGIYIDELCYQTHMLTSDIIRVLKVVNDNRDIISESADPRLVDEISLAGFNIYPVEKGKGSVLAGIDKMKGMNIYITKRSLNAIKEFKNYKYKQNKDGKWLNEPIDDYNHIIDFVRYVILMVLLGQSQKEQKNKAAFFH